MRRLKTKDVFAAMRLVKEAGLRDEVKRIALLVRQNKKLKIEDVGSDFIIGAFEGLCSAGAEKKAYIFLSGPFEMEPEEIENMDFMELTKKLKEFSKIESKEEWKAFFDAVANSIA